MKLLMHTCCAPCSVYCIESLRNEGIEPTCYWYNPNIHPYIEYKTRRDTLVEYSKIANFKLIINEEPALRRPGDPPGEFLCRGGWGGHHPGSGPGRSLRRPGRPGHHPPGPARGLTTATFCICPATFRRFYNRFPPLCVLPCSKSGMIPWKVGKSVLHQTMQSEHFQRFYTFSTDFSTVGKTHVDMTKASVKPNFPGGFAKF